MEALTHALQSDRQVKLVIGHPGETTTFFIWQTVLEHTSEYFRNALTNEKRMGNGERGTLKVPEDDITAWKALLYWIVKRDLPPREELMPPCQSDPSRPGVDLTICIRSLALGDKYHVPALQNLVMLEILRVFESLTVDSAEVKVAFESTPPGSVIRELMAEELATKVGSSGSTYEELDVFDGIVGVSSVFARKLARNMEGGKNFSHCPRIGRVPSVNAGQIGASWREFMVDEGPKEH